MDRQLTIINKQTEIMSKQADIMNQQMICGERAWVVVQQVIYNEFKAGEKPWVFITISNAGDTPALNTFVKADMGFMLLQSDNVTI